MIRFRTRYTYTLSAFVLAGSLFLSSCGVSRPTYRDSEVAVGNTKSEVLASIQHTAGSWRAFRATQQIRASLGSREISSRMSMHCVRGEGIRLVLTPFPLVEAVRAWFTREGITVVDVLGGRYAQESYATISARLGVDIAYEQVEALFIGRMFTHRGASVSALRALNFAPQSDGGSVWSAKLSGRYTYAFELNKHALLVQAHLSRGMQELLRVTYHSYFALDDTDDILPREMTFVLPSSVIGERNRAELGIECSRATFVAPEELSIEPIIKPSYSRITIDQIIKMIKSKSL